MRKSIDCLDCLLFIHAKALPHDFGIVNHCLSYKILILKSEKVKITKPIFFDYQLNNHKHKMVPRIIIFNGVHRVFGKKYSPPLHHIYKVLTFITVILLSWRSLKKDIIDGKVHGKYFDNYTVRKAIILRLARKGNRNIIKKKLYILSSFN